MPDQPHIALAGRSNAGKSTLANAIVGAKIARTSKTPGRTQMVGVYQGSLKINGIEQPVAVADLPGFGYAKVEGATRRSWEDELPRYYSSEVLIITLLCVDPRLEPQDSDLQLLDWLYEFERPVFVIATKWDKLNQKAQSKAQKYRDTYQLHPAVAGWYPSSGTTGYGLPKLRSAIATFFTYQ